HHRTDYAASMIDGRTVMECDPGGRSAQEIENLWAYLSDRLEKNFRRTVFTAPAMQQAAMAGAIRPIGGGFGRRVNG
ncbi:MAG: ParA family protein, partial [Sphingopyxis sp.]